MRASPRAAGIPGGFAVPGAYTGTYDIREGGVATGNRNPMSMRLSWPSAAWGDMPIEGGVEDAADRYEVLLEMFLRNAEESLFGLVEQAFDVIGFAAVKTHASDFV